VVIVLIASLWMSSAYDADTIDVHIICHSHTDAGWYSNYDSYFGRVKNILDPLIPTLVKNKNYKFNWADTSFLARYYKETSADQRQKLHTLVDEGRFQFMGSGWVMNDESLSSYKNAFIQLETGISWIEETFGVRPRIGYQIDPFGNSPVTPSMLSILGYEGVVLSRIGTTLDWDLETSESSEFIWEGSELDNRNDGKPILAHHLVRSKYQPPVEFKFQAKGFPFWVHPRVMCSNKAELKKNYKKCIQLFWDEVVSPSLTGHRHNQVFSIWGEDFAFPVPEYSLGYIDDMMTLLRDHFEEVTGKKINVFYSTVNEYFDAVKNFNGGNITFPVYKGDFMPYVQLEDGNFDHWVGYYSSTPNLKQMIRNVFQRFRAVKLEVVIGKFIDSSSSSFTAKLKEIQEEVSIMMHHDAITSTSPDGTLIDYKNRIIRSESKIDQIENELLNVFTKSSSNVNSADKKSKLKGTTLVTIMNPIGYERNEIVNFTATKQYVEVYDSEGNNLKNAEVYIEYLAQYTPNSINTQINEYIVAFEVVVPPFSVSKFFYKEHSKLSDCNGKCVNISKVTKPNAGKVIKIENDHVEVTINPNEMISSYKDKWSGIDMKIPTKMYTYPSRRGQTTSGLYIFNPTHEANNRQIQLTQRYIQEGQLLTMVHSFYNLVGTTVHMVQSITINRSQNLAIKRSVRVTTKMLTAEFYEYTMRTDISQNFVEDETEIYVDNGAENQLRQYYTYEQAVVANMTNKNYLSYIGLNGYGSIYGTAFKSANDVYFGFVNSNSILVHSLNRTLYEIMLMRNTEYYDDKGITSPLQDKNMETFDQILYTVRGNKEFHHVQKALSTILNDKLQVKVTSKTFDDKMDTRTITLIDDVGISAGFGDIDLIDVDIDQSGKFINWKIRNVMPFNVTLHPNFKIEREGKSGIQLNTRSAFKANETLPVPLEGKKDPYSDIRDLFTQEMEFANYNDTSHTTRIYGFVDVYTPLSNFGKSGQKHSYEMQTLNSLQSYKQNDGSETAPIIIPVGPEIPTGSPKEPEDVEGGNNAGDDGKPDTDLKPIPGYPKPKSSDPKPPKKPFEIDTNPADLNSAYDPNAPSINGTSNNCGGDGIPM
jgi:hypothetical protein